MTMNYPLRIRVRQRGYVFSRRDALEFATSDEQLRAWHASGEVRRCSQGVYYVPSSLPAGPEVDSENDRRRIRATLLALGAGHFATHQSALLAWGLPVDPDGRTPDVHVGRYGERHWSRRAGVRLHRVPTRAVVTTSQDITTISAAYAVAQVCATAGVETAVVAADAALHESLVSMAELADAVEGMRGSPGCSRLTALLDLVDALSESPGESRLRIIFRAAGIAVTPQVTVRDESGRFVARVDLLVDNAMVIVEFDGLLKYRGAENCDALVNEKRRQLALERLGYSVVRYVWADLADPDRVVALVRYATEGSVG